MRSPTYEEIQSPAFIFVFTVIAMRAREHSQPVTTEAGGVIPGQINLSP